MAAGIEPHGEETFGGSMDFENERGSCSVNDEALRWLVRLRSGDVSTEERRAFDAWIVASPDHHAAFGRAKALWGELDVLSHHFPRRRTPPRIWRQWGALALAACIVAAVVLRHQSSAEEVFSTGTAETRAVTLADGSTVWLAADTRLVREATWAVRRFRLEQGEAIFDVSHNPFRPFEVAIGDAIIRDIGTRFDVNRLSAATQVSVFEGEVALVDPRGPDRTTLSAGQGARISSSGAASQPFAVTESEVAAWLQGQVVVSDEPLGNVVERLNRYRPAASAIRLETDSVGRLRVSGSFDAADGDGALALLEKSHAVTIRRLKNGALALTDRQR